MPRTPPTADDFRAALTAATMAAYTANGLIRAATEGPPIQGRVLELLEENRRRPKLPPPDQDKMDQVWLVGIIGSLSKVQQEYAGKIASVRYWLRLVVDRPVHLNGITRATAHELAWDFANQLRLDIKHILFDRGASDMSVWPDLEQCRTHWKAIRDYLRSLANLNVAGLAAHAAIESAHAEARFTRSAASESMQPDAKMGSPPASEKQKPSEVAGPATEPPGSPPVAVDKEILALALLAKYGPNVSKIAKEVGLPRTTLLGKPTFREALDNMRAAGEQAKRSRCTGRRAGPRDFQVDDNA